MGTGMARGAGVAGASRTNRGRGGGGHPPLGPPAGADLPPADPRYSEGSATQQGDRSRQRPTSVGGGEDLPTRALYRLMPWMSPAYPVGAFSYSGGLEWAVEAGDIRDAE